MTTSLTKAESTIVLGKYRELLRSIRHPLNREELRLIHEAFKFSVNAHRQQRRKSGEPYIYHPIAVAQIVAEKMGLGYKAICSALLHDTVEDTDATLEDIEKLFGKQIALIVDGLTKISSISDANVSIQAENFRKMLLTISNDVRVILVKIADRLHNMRTLDSMTMPKQVKIASETLYIYAPLAHRLGLYNIKTELEDLALRFTEPESYNFITEKLREGQQEQDEYVRCFIEQIKDVLDDEHIDMTITGRSKSIYSIHKKMVTKKVSFEEVYDRFAIRIVYKCDEHEEKFLAWKIYSIVTDKFRINPARLRDWISNPKSTGYEALHTTVMGPGGNWVEVQIRSDRMNELAEKGYAAHYKYKHTGESSDSYLDDWINKVRETLENIDLSAIDFVNDFKNNLLVGEIYIFTPKGDLRNLPKGATALDFAFAVHSAVGSSCLGAKVNGKLVPLNHLLQNGDQVEIITGKNQKPKASWLEFVKTSRAKNRIKAALNEEKKEVAQWGRELFERKLRHLKIDMSEKVTTDLINFFKIGSSQELFYRMGKGLIDNASLKHFVSSRTWLANLFKNTIAKTPIIRTQARDAENKGYDKLVFGENEDNFDYTLAQCCNPKPGDDVFGFITANHGMTVHKTNCVNAVELRANFAYRILPAKWVDSKDMDFHATLEVGGIDRSGLLNDLTRIISETIDSNIESINFTTKAGVFTGEVALHVKNRAHLRTLMARIREVEGIDNVREI